MADRYEDTEATTSRPQHCHQIKFPTTRDGRVKLYGRNKELKRLRKCYNDLMQSHSNNKAAVFVSGVHGVGKTALIDEFLFQPFDRRSGRQRRGGGGGGARNNNNNSSSRQHSVIRCNFSEEQDGYQSWEEIYSNLREMALKKQQAKVDAKDDNTTDDDDNDTFDTLNELLEIEDILIESAPSGGNTAAPPNAQNTTSKESIQELLSIICTKQLEQPLILFLDDCQKMNATSLEVLSHLLFEELYLLGDVFIICAHTSTSSASSNNNTTPFDQFLDQSKNRMNREIFDVSMISIGGGVDKTVEAIHVYPLALETVTAFITDCSNQRDQIEVTSLAQVIYEKTMGVISHVRSAMNELIEKSLIQPTALPNYLTGGSIVDDVILSILSQVKEQLSLEVQRILTMMACMPNKVFHSSMLCELLYLEEGDVLDLLQQASSLLRISSSPTLTVSFSHDLIRQALKSLVSEEEKNDLVAHVFSSHFRKWREKRMHVREGKKAPKLQREMKALVSFFSIIDPSSLLNGDVNNRGNLADSNISRNSNVSGISDASSGSFEPRPILPVSKSLGHNLNEGRRRLGARRNISIHAKSLSFGSLKPSDIKDVARSLDVNATTQQNAAFPDLTSNDVIPTNAFAKLMSSITSNGSSSKSLKELIQGETDQDPITAPQLPPGRRQKQAIESIFFPFVSDPKSVLILHGSVCLHSCDSPTFTSDNELCCKLENERQLMIFSQGFIVTDFPVEDSYHLMMALTDGDAITQESMMEYLRVKLGQDDNVSTALLRDVLKEIAWPKYENFISNIDPENKGQVNRAELHRRLENVFSLPLSPNTSKDRCAQFASLFTSVARVDCLDISHSRDTRSRAISNCSLAERSFSITLNDRDDDILFTCLDQKQRDSFVSALRSGVLKAIEKSSSPEAVTMRKNTGWQHLVVRNSPICYVLLNDAESLERILEDSRRDGDDAFGEIRFKLSELDENGYAAIHYACLLGRAQCVDILLEKGISNAGMLDVRGMSPLDLAISDDVIEVLDKERGTERKPPARRMSLTKTKSRPGLSRKQSSFRRLRGIPKPRRKVTFAVKDDSTRSLELYSSDSDSGEDNEPYVASMPNLRSRRSRR